MNNTIDFAIEKLDKWIENHDWKAYDPFDGLSSKYTKQLTLNNPILKIILQQSIRRFPINLRKILAIKPETSSKAMGFFAQGYLHLYQTYHSEIFLDKAIYCLNWLINNPSDGYSGYCWGNHFDYQSRGGRIPKGVPTVVWTGLIGHSFMDAYELTGDEKYLSVVKSISQFIVNDLPRVQLNDSLCIGYTPQKKDSRLNNAIHNSNMIGASILARLYNETKDSILLNIAAKAVKFTIHYQLEDGGFYYGVARKHHWIDSFHTGYVLEALYNYIKYSRDENYRDNLIKGYGYFINTFFGIDGTPKYYNYKTNPLDIQCASQGIQTLTNLRSLDSRSIEIAKKVASWTITNMQDSSGYFYFRKYPFIINKTPTLHWGQATMLAALAILNHNLLKE
ncbi:MAG TPA: hypothetical protein PKZ42_01150 [Syntrophales bacterium]|nr:hypothetical protein [Syntrophales bacterium]